MRLHPFLQCWSIDHVIRKWRIAQSSLAQIHCALTCPGAVCAREGGQGSNQSYDVCKITVFQPPGLRSLLLNLICSPLFSRLQRSAIFLSQDYLSSMLSMTLTTVVIGRRIFSCSTVRAIGWPSMIPRMLKPQCLHYIPQVGLTAGLPKAAMIPYPFTNHHCSDSQFCGHSQYTLRRNRSVEYRWLSANQNTCLSTSNSPLFMLSPPRW